MKSRHPVAGRIESLERRTLLSVNLVTGGEPDLSFGQLNQGPPVISVAAQTNSANDMIILPSGRILLLGQHFPSADDQVFSTVIRTDDSGTLDSTFGVGGIARLPQPHGLTMLVKADGQILVAGATIGVGTTSTDGVEDILLQQLNPDGTVDTAFGSGGTVTTDVAHRQDTAVKVLQQSDGRIVVVGYEQKAFLSRVPQTPHVVVARYEANGQLDSSFGNNGIVLTDLSAFAVERASSAVLQSDGKILVAGTVQQHEADLDHGPSPTQLLLMRYNTDGSLDTSFGKAGVTITKRAATAADVELDSHGRILVAGSRITGADQSAVVLRFKSGGGVDSAFGKNGLAIPNFRRLADTPQDSSTGTKLVVRADGALTLAARVGSESIGLTRLSESGKLNKSWGNKGMVLTTSPDFVDNVNLAVQPDGKLVTSTGGAGITLRRFMPDTIAPFARASHGILRIQGTLFDDSLTVETQVGAVDEIVRINRGGYVQMFVSTGISQIRIDAGDGNDSVSLLGETLPALIVGGAGNDIIVGSRAADRIFGGAGNDTITGSVGVDRIDGGPGNDTLFARDGESDRLIGGPGADEAQVDVGIDHSSSIETLLP